MLRLQEATVADILTHAAQATGLEVCGLVWQASGPGDALVQKARQLRNVHPHPDSYYTVSTSDLRQAFREMDEQGGEPLAFYHSHPGGKPDPSEEDMLGALNVGMHYLIAYPRETLLYEGGLKVGQVSQWELSVWECIDSQVLVEASYEVVP